MNTAQRTKALKHIMKTRNAKGLATFSAMVIFLSANGVHGYGAKDGDTQVRKLLTPAQSETLLNALQADSKASQELPCLRQGLEAVIHAKGRNYKNLTLEDAAQWLGRDQGHGAFFEQRVAEDLAQHGFKVEFAKAGNIGADLRVFPTASTPMTLVQVKATGRAIQSAEESLLDGLAFAGGNANRSSYLAAEKLSFQGIIPSDQFAELVHEEKLLKDGRPSPAFIDNLLIKATQRSRLFGPNGDRIRAALPNARAVLEQAKVQPGPLTYEKLMAETKASAESLRTIARQVAQIKAGLRQSPVAQVSVASRLAPVPDSTVPSMVVDGSAVKASQLVTEAKKTFPNLSAKCDDATLLRRIATDPTLRGNLRGRVAEADWINRNAAEGWKQVARINAPENDAWRRVGGTLEGAQVKVHANWHDYIRSMQKDSKAERFVLPDDHYELVYKELEARRLGALRGHLTKKAEDYAQQQKRLTKLGRTFKQVDGDIESAAKTAELMSKLGKTVRTVVRVGGGVAAVIVGPVQMYNGAEEIRNGRVPEGVADVGSGTATAVTGGALLASKLVLAGGAGGAAATLDGAKDVYVGIRDGNAKTTACGGIKAAAGAAMIAGTVTAQPEVVVAGAIVYGVVVVGEIIYEFLP